jgi:RimJ/RimL family protein N-acetyltransferase
MAAPDQFRGDRAHRPDVPGERQRGDKDLAIGPPLADDAATVDCGRWYVAPVWCRHVVVASPGEDHPGQRRSRVQAQGKARELSPVSRRRNPDAPPGVPAPQCLVLIDHWPLLGLRVRTARLELRLPTEEELAELAEVAARGVHEPGQRPFLTPWTDLPPEERAREVVQRQWRRRGAFTPQAWTLEFGIFEQGRPVGMQELGARDFATLREVRSSSWLGLKDQGRGIGSEMRSAVLHLAFAGLDAAEATTVSFTDNAAALGVSRRLGYRPDGVTRDVLHGGVVVSQRLRLTREQWELTDRPEITIIGLEPCLPQFGLVASK